MLEQLKKEVYEANMMLPENGLVKFTWGNVSGIDRESGIMVIKPSGVPYNKLTPSDMVAVDIKTGQKAEEGLNPSSDAPTHMFLYNSFSDISGIVHTHSRWATVFAQCGKDIPPLGTTHADHFYGAVPCTRKMTAEEIAGDYEYETGRVIAEAFANGQYKDIPAALVYSHGPFIWGKSPSDAVYNATVLEEVAFMAYHTLLLCKDTKDMQSELLDKHYQRKHGENAYYGQKK